MARPADGAPWLHVRLIHDGAQPGTPLPEPLRFGIQDTKGEVHAGIDGPHGTVVFDLGLDVVGDGAADAAPVFRGGCAQGPPGRRFLYLAWKRVGEHVHPWGWRIKIPLAGIGWAEVRAAQKPGMCIAANVIGRRPHASEPIGWRIIESR